MVTARAIIPGALGVAALLAAGRFAKAPEPQRHLPAVLGEAPAFMLTDQTGQPFGSERLQGKIWVADFIFTECAGQCPLMTERLRGVQRQFAQEPALSFVSFSMDPDHDTPVVLQAYAQRHGADARWRLLTGPSAAVQQLSVDGFRLAADQTPSAQEPIVHSMRLVLVDRHGMIRGYYPASDSQAMSQLAADIRALLREG